MTRRYRYVQADVFTDRPFGGNQLAVFVDARGLTPEEMQLIAREMSFSETTFVLPSELPEAAKRVRIFTPAIEMPMAGHPTVGTAHVLARRGEIPRPEATLELGIGPVRVTIEDDFVWMTHRAPEFGAVRDDRDAVAAAIGVSANDLVPEWPVAVVSTGIPFLIVPLRTRAAVGRCRPDEAALRRLGVEPIYLFTMETEAPDARFRARMFAPHAAGVPEDPATGSAAAPLGAYRRAPRDTPPGGARPLRHRAGDRDRPAEPAPRRDALRGRRGHRPPHRRAHGGRRGGRDVLGLSLRRERRPLLPRSPRGRRSASRRARRARHSSP